MNDEGGASIALLAVAALGLALAIGLAGVGALFRARTEAAAAADAAALAAAPVTFSPFGARGTPAEEAARFARDNGASLVWCICPPDESWNPRTVEVEVARDVTIWPFGVITVTGRGRAEFIPAALLGE